MRDAVFGNAGTLVTFRVGGFDAEFLEKEFIPTYEAKDMVNLPNFNTYTKLMIDGVAGKPFSTSTFPPHKVTHESFADVIIRSMFLPM